VDTPEEAIPDTTPPDELGAARLPLTTALNLGMPMFTTGDGRGAHEVYACAGRMILHAVPMATILKEHLEAAIDHADLEPDPMIRAEILQSFLIELLGLPDDSDEELEPLDTIQGHLASAISLGAPAYNLGMRRGCYEVYAATARLVVATIFTPEEALHGLRNALAEAAKLTDEKQRAWVLRNAFDDILRMKAGKTAPKISRRDVRLLISMAIQIGAPAYNLGDHRGCYEVYATTARLLVQVAAEAERECEVLRTALMKASLIPDVTEQAWTLRRTFDAILGDASV
jgi:hypothetical protein